MHSAMEQTRSYMMWSRRKILSTVPPPPHPLFNSPIPVVGSGGYRHDEWSWEERAFAEDSSGGGCSCVWPPRSYSCSFCGREFRSAQALGGHMNVHRRDRARLKRSPSPSPTRSENPHLPDRHHQYLAPEYYNNTNPNPNPSPNSYGVEEYYTLVSDPASYSSSSSPMDVHNQQIHHSSPPPPPPSFTDTFDTWKSKVLVGKRHRREVDDDEVLVIDNYKRRRFDDSVLRPPVVMPEVLLKLGSATVEGEMDLELRLGDPPPKVK